jgi:hypothetical protein
VLAVLAPFLAMGCYRAHSKDHIGQNEALFRDLQRAGTVLIRNVRVFTGDGQTIENGACWCAMARSPISSSKAPRPIRIRSAPMSVEGAGKTLLPGLIDVHVHLGGPAGISNERRLRRRRRPWRAPRPRCSIAASLLPAARATPLMRR